MKQRKQRAILRASNTLKAEVWNRRFTGVLQRDIAIQAGMHPSVLSAILHGMPLVEQDARIDALAKVLDMLPSACVEPLERRRTTTQIVAA